MNMNDDKVAEKLIELYEEKIRHLEHEKDKLRLERNRLKREMKTLEKQINADFSIQKGGNSLDR